MKIVEQSHTDLKLTDPAGCFWLFGLFFLIVSEIFIAGLLGLFSNLDELSNPEKAAAWFVSVGVFSAGLYFIYQNPGSAVHFDKINLTFKIIRSGLFKNVRETFNLLDIDKIYLNESTDTDGDPVYKLEVKLKTGESKPLSVLWINNKEYLQNTADKINDFLMRI